MPMQGHLKQEERKGGGKKEKKKGKIICLALLANDQKSDWKHYMAFFPA